MPTYCGQCPKCAQKIEYFCSISDKETALPVCPDCKDENGQPVKTKSAFMANTDGTFILRGHGWFKKGGY